MCRKFLVILLILIGSSINNYACTCTILSTISSDYQTSDFVAVVKIIKNYKNYPDNSEYYKADIEILNLYKGKKIRTIQVLGNNGNNSYNSCGTFIQEGEIRLIFGNLNKENFISTYLCTSYYQPLSKSYQLKSIPEKLRLLKKHAKNYILKVNNEGFFYPIGFKFIQNPQRANQYSLIKIVLNENKKIKAIVFLTKEPSDLKAIYTDYFTHGVDWEVKLRPLKLKRQEDLTLIFEISPYKT